MTRPGGAVVDLTSQVEAYLSALDFAPDPPLAPLSAAMRRSLALDGDRIRPVAALATAHALGREPSSVLPLAAAVEMIHVTALVHDDVPAADRDLCRVGAPIPPDGLGEGVTLLAGDALLAEAIALVLREQDGEPGRLLAAVGELAHAAGVGGRAGGRGGALLGAAVRGVVSLDGVSGAAATALRRFAAAIGVLLQVVHDAPGPADGRTRLRAEEAHRTACAALGDARRTEALREIADGLLARAA